MKYRTRSACSVGAAALLSSVLAHAFPIAPLGTEGYVVIATAVDPITVTYEGNSAAYSNDLYLERNALGNPGLDGDSSNDLFIFNNHASVVGSSLVLGAFAPGTELVFRLDVHDTGYSYFSGPGTRNPDGLPHARVQDNWEPLTTLVSFEDLFGTPEYPGGYNDLSFSFTNTRAAVPEPAAAGVLFGLAAVGVGFLGRRRP